MVQKKIVKGVLSKHHLDENSIICYSFLSEPSLSLYYLLESAFVVAYLDTVYFEVTEWQQKLYR